MASKLYVGGLSFDTTEQDLKTFFEQAGTVESVAIVSDRYSGRSRGFGFVEMSTNAEARKAIEELSGKTLDGRTISVDEARPPQQRSGGGGGYGGGGGGRGGGGGYGGGGGGRGGGGGGSRRGGGGGGRRW